MERADRTIARLHLARLLDRLEESGHAIDLLSDGLARVPDHPELLALGGAIKGRVRKYREAESGLSRVLRLYPSPAPAELELGLVLWRKGMIPEAAAHFRQALDHERQPAGQLLPRGRSEPLG
ncbi:MAG: tetratricopeptide repeat protein [Gemmatimonadales bacterium]|nr:tetratricopeptide repeat protein [Gemmatimonadales bacterium]